MNIVLNNKNEYFEQDGISIENIMQIKNFTFKMLIIKLNGSFVEKDKYAETIVNDGDDLQILHLISGG